MTADGQGGGERPTPGGPGRLTRRSIQLLLVLVCLVILIRSQPRSLESVRAPGSSDAAVQTRGGSVGPGVPGPGTPEVDWVTLAGLDYQTGEMTPALEALVGTEVRVPGFMVPLEQEGRRVSRFLLVPYVGACVHTPAPPPNQLVLVRTPPGESVEVEWWDPVWVRAELELDPRQSAYGAVSWTMVAGSVEPYDD